MAGRDILHGVPPYHPETLDRVQTEARTSGVVPIYATATYPAPALMAGIPLSFESPGVASTLAVLVCAIAPAAALILLGVRDWRCVAATYGAFSVFSGIRLGAVSPVLFLGVAALWRWRDRRWTAPVVLAALVASKLYLWPLTVWLWLTTRWRAAVRAAALALAACAVGWWIVGWETLPAYPSLIAKLSSVDQGQGQSLVALGMRLGLSSRWSAVLMVAVGMALMRGAIKARRHSDADVRIFLLCVVACLAFSPVVWNHYLILLFIPLSLKRPTFDPSWLLPWLLVLSTDQIGHPDSAAFLVGNIVSLVVTASVLLVSLSRRCGQQPVGAPAGQ